MKTIRQIADEIGVSKTAVSKQIANLGLRSGLRKNGNQFAIDEHQEALIKQAFSEKSQTEIKNQSQTKTQTENREIGDLVCVLQATIDTLQGQLEVKDRQIEQQTLTITRLTDALAAAQQTAAAAQVLHAGTLKQLITSDLSNKTGGAIMDKAKIFLIIGIVMLSLAVIFVVYAFCNPQASFSISSDVIYVFYLIYFIITVLMFVLAAKFRK